MRLTATTGQSETAFSSSSSSSSAATPSTHHSSSKPNLLLSNCVFGSALPPVQPHQLEDGYHGHDPLSAARVKRRRSAGVTSDSSDSAHSTANSSLDPNSGKRVLFGYVPSEQPEPIGRRFSFYRDKARNNPLVSKPQIVSEAGTWSRALHYIRSRHRHFLGL